MLTAVDAQRVQVLSQVKSTDCDTRYKAPKQERTASGTATKHACCDGTPLDRDLNLARSQPGLKKVCLKLPKESLVY